MSAHTVDVYAYARPDPVRVARTLAGYGIEAVLELWPSRSEDALRGLAAEGRAILRGRTSERPKARFLSPEQEDLLVQRTMSLKRVTLAALEAGVSEHLVRTIFREKGLRYPIKPARERSLLGHARRRAALAQGARS